MDSNSIARFAKEVELEFVPVEGEETYHVNVEGLSTNLCEISIHHEQCKLIQEGVFSEEKKCPATKKNSFLMSPIVGVGKLLIFHSRFYFLLSLEHVKTRIDYECLHCRDMIPEKDKKVLKFHGFLEET